MHNFESYNPVKLIFGPGETDRIGEAASPHEKGRCWFPIKTMKNVRSC